MCVIKYQGSEKETLRYLAALTLFDGYFDIRPGKNYEIIIADENKEFLEQLVNELKMLGVKSSLRPGTRDRAWRLRIYGKRTVYLLKELSEELLAEPDSILLAAAIDAEGSIVTQTSQPLRVRIVLKKGVKAKAVKKALLKTGVKFLEYTRCRIKGECKYVEYVISNKNNVSRLIFMIRLKHPAKLSKILTRLGWKTNLSAPG